MPTTKDVDYAHRTLAWLRTVTRDRSLRAASVKALAKDEERLMPAGTTPVIGDVILWPTVGKYGDCGLLVGPRTVLLLMGGKPTLARIDYYQPATFRVLAGERRDLPAEEKP